MKLLQKITNSLHDSYLLEKSIIKHSPKELRDRNTIQSILKILEKNGYDYKF